jgi:hypothetical protein
MLAFTLAVQAGDTKTTKTSNGKEQSPCCAAKATACSESKALASGKSCSAGGCGSEKATKQALLSPKASAELAKK